MCVYTCLLALQVPLGIYLKGEQKYEEMIDVLSHLNQYIPTVSTESTVNVAGIEEPVRMTNDFFHTIALGMCIFMYMCCTCTCSLCWFCTCESYVCSMLAIVGGDQMTAARTRGCQRIRSNAERGKERLQGFNAFVEDWHAKGVLLGVGRTHVHAYICAQCTLHWHVHFRWYGSVFMMHLLEWMAGHYINYETWSTDAT